MNYKKTHIDKGKTYGNVEIQKITGLSKTQIYYITQNKIIVPLTEASGRGSRRKYSWQNVVEFLIVRELYKLRMDTLLMVGVIRALDLPTINYNGDFISFWNLYKIDPETDKIYHVIQIESEKSQTDAITDWQELSEHLKRKFTSFTVINLRRLIDEADKVF